MPHEERQVEEVHLLDLQAVFGRYYRPDLVAHDTHPAREHYRERPQLRGTHPAWGYYQEYPQRLGSWKEGRYLQVVLS